MKFHRSSKPSRKNSHRPKKQGYWRRLPADDTLSRFSILRHEKLEDRTLLSATEYVGNAGSFSGSGVGGVTWDPGPGTQFSGPVSGLTMNVNAFTSIQAAANAAASGDTLDVAPGTYSEKVSVNVSGLTIDGAQFGINGASASRGTNESIVNGADLGSGIRSTSFYVTASDVTINGFTVTGETSGNDFGFAIDLSPGTSGSHVINNVIQDSVVGIALSNNSSTDQTVIQGNLIQDNNQAGPTGGTGIYLDQFTSGAVQNVLIDSNTFTNNQNDAIILGSTDNAKPTTNATISNNVFNGGNGGGVFMFNTTGSKIIGNTVTDSTGSGITFAGGDSNDTVTDNTITDNNTSSSYIAAGIEVGNLFVLSGVGPNSNLSINYNNIENQANGGYGLEVDPNPATGTSNPNVVGPSYTGGASSLDATNNYWGSPSGPTSPSNPGGTGNGILDPNNQVNFSPFLTSPAGVSATLSIVGGNFEIVDAHGNVLFQQPTSDTSPINFTNNSGQAMTLTVDYSNGDPAPGGFNFTGGGSDSLVITGYATTATLTETFTGPHTGTVQVNSDGKVTYSKLLPVSNIGTAADIIFNLPSNADAVLQDNGSGTPELVSTNAAFEATTFTAPSSSLTLTDTGSGDTFTTAASFTADYTAGLTINGNSTTDSVTFNTLNLTTGTATLSATGQTINLGAVTAGTSATLTAGGSVDSSGASPITTPTLTLSSGAGMTLFTSVGDLTATNSTSGNITITQTASPATALTVTGTGVVNSANTGTIALDNLGSSITVGSGSKVQSDNGAITLSATAMTLTGTVNSGTGRTTLDNSNPNEAIDIGTDLAGELGLTQTDLNHVTANVLQIGSPTAGNINVSAAILNPLGWMTLTLSNGSTITEAAAGTLTVPMLSVNSAGPVTLTNVNDVGSLAASTTDAFSFNNGTNLLTVAPVDFDTGIATSNADINLTADQMSFGAQVNAGTATVTIQPATASRNTVLGGSTATAGTLSLINAGLSLITASVLQIGSATYTGNIEVLAGMSAPHVGVVKLVTSGTVTADGAKNTANTATVTRDTTDNTFNDLTITGEPAIEITTASSLDYLGGSGTATNQLTVTENAAGLPLFNGAAAGSHTNAAFTGSTPSPANVGINMTGAGAGSSMVFNFINSHNVTEYSDNVASANSGVVAIPTVGAATGLNVSFNTLSPLTYNGAGGTLTLSDSANSSVSSLTLTDSFVGHVAGESQVQGNGSWETATLDGWDSLLLQGNNANNNSITQVSVDGGATNGHALTSVTLQGGSGNDTISVDSSPAAITTTLLGGDGTNNFDLDAAAGGHNLVANILGPVIVSPAGMGEPATAVDTLNIDDSGDTAGRSVQITSTAINGITGATAPAITYDGSGQIATVNITGDGFGNTFNIQSTNSTTATLPGAGGYNIFTGNGNDTVNVSGTAPAVNGNGTLTGDLSAILGPVNLATGTGNGVTFPDTDTDTLNVSDYGNTTGGATYTLTSVKAGTQLTTSVSAAITYDAAFAPLGLAATHGQLENFNLIGSQKGGNVYNIHNTSATTETTIQDGDASSTTKAPSTFVISGDNLSANNTFKGEGGGNTFFLNIAANLFANSVLPDIGIAQTTANTSLTIAGDGGGNNAGSDAVRNELVVNDNSDIARDLNYVYQDSTGGDLNLGGFFGGGLAGTVVSGNLPVQVRSMQTLIFNSVDTTPANANDVVQVTGTAGNDQLTVTEMPTTAGSGKTVDGIAVLPNGVVAGASVGVFLDGTPYLNAPPTALLNPGNKPGVAGGSAGPDLVLNGVSEGLTLDGGGNTGTAGLGDQAIVYAASESSLTTSANGDPLGLGAGVLQPGFGAGKAYDTIDVNDSTSGPDSVAISNNFYGQLLNVALASPTSFAQAGPAVTSQQPGLVVDGGDEATHQANGIADNFFVTPSSNYNIQVNGNLPNLTTVGGVPQGDQLNLSFAGSVNVYSNNASPPNVTLTDQGLSTPFGVKYSSIERVDVAPGNGIVNLIGNNDVVGNAQNDYFKVVGGPDPFGGLSLPANDGTNQFSLQIGGSWDPLTGAVGMPDVNQNSKAGLSAPIYFFGVTRINASGGAATGFDNQGNAIPDTSATAGVNALDITPWDNNNATNPNIGFGQTTGWGIETYYNQGQFHSADGGVPNDLVTVHGMSGVSENITVQPSASGAGQVYMTNPATGNTSIAVIKYVNNTNIVVDGTTGAAGDNDTLTLLGTNPNNPSTSGNDDFLANFAAAGTGTAPLVRVYDAGAAPALPRPSAAELADTAGTAANGIYNLQNVTNINTVNVNMEGGSDLFDLISGRTDGSLTVNVDGGPPPGPGSTLATNTVQVTGSAKGGDSFTIDPGASSDAGRVTTTLSGDKPTVLNFTNTSNVSIVGQSTAGSDSVTLDGTGGNDSFVATTGGVGATTGTARVNSGPAISFTGLGSGATSLTLNGLGGSDAFALTQAATGPIPKVTANGGGTSSATVAGDGHADTFAVNGGSANSVSVTVNGATGTTYGLNGMGSDLLDGVAFASSTLSFASIPAAVTPGSTTGSGVFTPIGPAGIAFLPVDYVHMSNPVTVSGGAVLTVNATDNNDTVSVDTAGDVTVTNTPTGATNEYAAAGYAKLVIDASGTNDAVTIAASAKFAGGIQVNGNGSTVLNFTGDGANGVTVDLGAHTVKEATFGAVTIAGVATVNVNTGGATLTVVGSGNDSMSYTPTGSGAGTVTQAGAGPVVNFTNQTTTFTLDPGTGTNSVTVNGTAGNDTIQVLANNVPGDTQVSVNALQPVQIVTADTQNLIVNGGTGNDALEIFSTFTPVTIPITDVGGPGTDALFLTSGGPNGLAATANVYTPGAQLGSGTDTLTFPTGTEVVHFANLAPIFDQVPGPLTVNGTNANNAISYAEGFDNLADFLAGTLNAAWGQVSVDGYEPMEFMNKTTLTINTGAGTDTVSVNNPNTPTGLTGIAVNGGDLNAGDTLILNGETDNLVLEPTSQGAGTVNAYNHTLVSTSFTNIGHLSLVSLLASATDIGIDGTTGNDNFVYTPGATPDTATITGTMNQGPGAFPLEPVTIVGAVQATSVVFNAFGQQGGTDTFVYNATAGNDAVSVTNGDSGTGFGGITLSDTVAGQLFSQLNLVNMGGVSINAGNNDQTFTVDGNVPNPITVDGNASQNDVLTFNGNGKAVTVDLGAGTVTDGAGTVSFSGIGSLNVNAGGATLTVLGTAGPDSLTYTPTGAAAGTLTSAGLNTVLNISNVTTAAGGFTINALGGANTVTVNGTSGADVIGVVKGATTTVKVNGFLTVNLPSATDQDVVVAAGDGADTINVSGTNTTQILNIQGGEPGTIDPAVSDQLNVTVATAGLTDINEGATPDTGTVFNPDGNINFTGLEVLNITNTAAGNNTIQAEGTDGNDNITLSNDAQVVGGNEYYINNAAVILFTNFQTANISGNFGDDTIKVAPFDLFGVTSVNVTGSLTSVDSLTVFGVNNPANVVSYNPAGSPGDPSPNVAITGEPVVNFDTSDAAVAHVTYQGAGTSDLLTVNVPTGSTTTFTPGSAPDAGSVQVGSLVPLTFSNLGNSGQAVSVAAAGAASLVYNGTAANDAFTVTGLTGPTRGQVQLNNDLPVRTNANVTSLTLNGLAGDNTYTVTATAANPLPYTTINVNGSGTADPDVLTLNGDGTAVTASVGTAKPSVSGGGLGTVNVSGVGTVNVNAGGGKLTATGTTGADTLAVTPTGANAASFQAYSGGTAQNGQGGTLASLTATGPAFNATNVSTAAGGFTINGNGGSDMLFVEATQSADTIDVNDATSGANAVKVGGALTVNYNAAMAQVEVDALAGSDTINIAPSTTTTFLVDGGDPIGVVPGDTLNLIHPPGPFEIFPGPTSDSGGLKTSGFQTVSWVHIESIVNTGGGSPIITGTNGNDEITVIARDSSYNPASPGTPNPLLDGVQDFTVSVNGGPNMLFINTPNLFIDAMSGNDDIVVEEPAPNHAAWNVQVFVAAGAPSSGANRLGDNIELETPGTEAVTYNPNSPLSSVPPVAGVTFTSPSAGGGQFNDTTDTSTVTATQFFFPGLYQSSSGGAENFIYAGDSGNDTLKYNTPAGAGSNLAYTPGSTADSGTITGSQSGTALTPLTFSSLGGTGSVSFTTSNAGRTDSLVYNGTAANDTFTVDAGTGTVHLNSQVPVLTSSIANLTLNDQTGDNTYNISATAGHSQPFTTINVNGSGRTDPDVLNLAGDGSAIDANFGGANPFVKDGGLGTVNIVGVGTVNLNANGGALTVNDTLADENLAVTPTGAAAGTFVVDGAAPTFNFSGANASGLVANLTGGGSTLAINGATTGETFTATNTSVTVTGDIPVKYTAAQLAQLAINGLGGLNATSPAGNTLIVNSTAAAVVTPIVYSGGIGTGNSLQLTGGTATSDIYQPGPNGGQGTDTLLFGAARESVQFSLLTPVFDSVAGPLTVNGTNGDDAINYIEGNDPTPALDPAWGQVSVNALEPINFTNKTSLAINALAGSDTTNLNNSHSPTGLTAITVDGGDPTAGSDTLIVNGAAGAGPVVYSPTAADGGKVTGAGPVGVTLTHIEYLYLNDQGLGDKVTVNGTAAGNDTFVHTPGSVNDAGNVALNSLLALNYQNLGTAGSININETGAGTNTLVVQGTANNDAFGVAGGTGTVTLNSRVPITETGIQNLQLNGLSASDTFTLNATMPYTNVAVNGANIANDDAVVFNGATGAIAVNLANQAASPPTLTTVTGYGGTVSLSDIAQASLNGTGAASLAVNGTPNDDQINYTPTSAAGGNFSLTGLNTAFSFSIGTGAANTFTINGGGSTGGDQVNVYGPNSGSTFITDEAARTVAVSNAAGTNLKPVTLGTGGTNEIQVVNLDAGIGNNTFLVAPAKAVLVAGKSAHVGAANFQVPSDLLVNVNGGGATSKNALVIGTNTGGTLAANLFAAVMRDTTDSGVIRMFQDSGGAEPIQYPDITYTGIGTVQTNTFDPAGDATGAKQQTLVMGPDAYEPNQTLATAAYLGNGSAINVANATIFPNSQEHQFVNANVDWFRVVAQYTGTLDFQVYFKQELFSTGDDALPGAGELNIDVYDSNSNLITSFGVNDTNSDQRRRLPVVAGETYYLKVSGADPSGLGINGYNMSIVNTPAPTPNAIGLNNVVAQGTVNNAIAPTTTTFAANNAPVPAPVISPNFQTQPLPPLSSLNNFYVGLYLEFTSGALIGQRQLVSGYTAATHTFTFASAFSAAPSPNDTFQIESDDTGRSQLDNITRDNLPTIYIRLDQANSPNDGLLDLQGGGSTTQTPPNSTPILIPFWAGNAPTAPNSPANNGSYRIAVFDETDPSSPIFLGYANAVAGQTGVFQLHVATPMSDGTHILVAKVEFDSPSTPSNHDVGAAVQLQIVVDTIAPPVYFGDPTVPNTGLAGGSDSGVPGQPATIADRITNVSTPTFYGVAEANAIVKIYAVTGSNSTTTVQNGDIFLGQTVATPADGTNQDPSGQWTITSSIDLNDPRYGFPLDGLRTILVTAEDAAGNVSAAQSLSIFVDTQGPTVNKINITGSPSFPLFATKLTTPATPSPTPLVNSLDITFNDLPNRVGPSFVYPAVNPILAETTSNYALVGEHTGVIPITSVTLVDNTVAGGPGNTTVTLHFPPQFTPLPDDRYTLTISNAITDNAGNPLQGSYNGAGFPSGLVSGNGSQGTSFVGSFTVNSRAHIGNYSSGTVDLDINGNGVFDPQNSDANNRDAVYALGYPTDRLFAGNFTSDYGNPSAPGTANGFDKLAAYGQDVNGNYRFLYDLSGLDKGPATVITEPFAIDGLPVAGNFDGVATDGDQVGLFDGTAWYLDVLNQGYISAADVATTATATHPAGKLVSDMAGLPFVGDFDGFLDLGTYQNGVMEFDLASLDPGHILTGQWNVKLNVDSLLPGSIPFNTVTARPVAGLLSGLGVQASFGLYLPGGTTSDAGTAQWYFLNPNSSATVVTSALTVVGGIGALTGNPFLNLIHQFQDQPLGGQDTFYQFGDQFSLPVVGIWDPPTNGGLTTGETTTPQSTANWIDALYSQILGRQPSASDLNGWVNAVNTGTTSAQVAATFVTSNEYRADQINQLYEQYLGRPADPAGVAYWTGVWNANGGPEEVQAGIIGSPEYYATAGKLYSNLSPDAAWVTALYYNILGRAPDASGLSYWETYIQTNSKESVVLGFVTSAEYRLTLINGWFETYLGRSLDSGGAQYWLQQMEQGLTQDQLLAQILGSDEYRNKNSGS